MSEFPYGGTLNRVQAGIDRAGFIQMAKAVMSSSRFGVSNEGKLNPAQVQKFQDYIQSISMFKDEVDFMTFRNEQKEIDSVNRSGRTLYPQTEGANHGVYRQLSFGKVTLQPVDFSAVAKITDKMLQINLEGDSFADHFLKVIAEGVKDDIDELIIHGNETGILGQDTDESGYLVSKYKVEQFLKQVDGVIKLGLASGTTLDVSGYTTSYFSPVVANAMERLIPENRMKFKPRMKYYVSRNADQDFEWKVSDVGGTGGFDYQLFQRGVFNDPTIVSKWHGIPIKPIPILANNPYQVDKHTFSSGGTYQLTHYPIQPNSQIIAVDSTAAAGYVTPYVEGTDYDAVDATGIITHDAGGSMTITEDVNITYQGPGIGFLTWPYNIVLGMSHDNMEIEFDRIPLEGTDVVIIRVSLDLVIRDYTSFIIAHGMTYRDYSAL